MARAFHNIEKLPNRENYTGYSPRSGVWIITGKTGNYYARARNINEPAFFARTLAECSAQLNWR